MSLARRLKGQFACISDTCCPWRSSSRSPVYLLSAESRPTRAAANRAPLGDSFISPEEMEHLSVLMNDTEFPASGARHKSKSKKTKKVKAESSQPEASSSSVADLIQLELLRKENPACPPAQLEFPSLDQLRSRKKTGTMLLNSPLKVRLIMTN